MPKLVYVVTVPMTARILMAGHLSYMHQQGFAVTVIASPGEDLELVAKQELVEVVPISIEREISPWRDLVSLVKIYQVLCQIQPDIVNASTPKAGLLGMIAAWLARVPVRIYLLRGLRAETATGLKGFLLAVTERVAAWCSNQVVAVSQSLAQVYVAQNLAPSDKIIVLGGGSSNGVNTKKFALSKELQQSSIDLCTELSIPLNVPVIGFVGRFTQDKGIADLVNAFEVVLQSLPNAYLLLVGKFETGDPIDSGIVAKIRAHPQIVEAGFVADTAPYYQMMRVFAFPSYREGFPNSPLEAALLRVPTVGFNATGICDAVIDQITGILVPTGDVEQLAKALTQVLTDDVLHARLATNGYERAVQDFRPEKIWENWQNFYSKSLKEYVSKVR